jgi:hypothetical protein
VRTIHVELSGYVDDDSYDRLLWDIKAMVTEIGCSAEIIHDAGAWNI